MSGVRILADMGPLRVTVDTGSQWTPDADEDCFPSDDEVRFHSLDESRSGHRSSWTEGFEDGATEGHSHHQEATHGRQLHPPPLGFRRRMSPARLQIVSDVTRLRHRSSSGGRRHGGDTAAAKEQSVSDGGQSQGHGRVLRLSRDSTQPNSGSVSDLRGSVDPDDEESDVLPALGDVTSVRPRANTCPDIKVIQRRTKIRLLNRPPTPTPGDELAPNGLALEMEKSCSLSNSGEIYAHDEEDDPLPVISET